MNKRNIIIISSILVLILLGLAGYFIFGRTPDSPDTNTDATPTPESSYTPSASDGPIFSPTPNATTNVCPSFWSGMDSDGDELPDGLESVFNVDPANPDSDSDGYKDGNEIKNGYDPMNSGNIRLDSDKDGLLDNEECTWKTNPFISDTDGDNYKDGEEVKNGYDPTRPGNVKISDPVVATPTPSGLILNSPVPTPENLPGNTTIDLVKRSELKISANNSAVAVRNYIAAINSASPVDLVTGSTLPDALTAAFAGNASKLYPVIARFKQQEQQIVAISTPEAAVAHQTLLVSLMRFVNIQLTTIATSAGKNTAQQNSAAQELQKKLSANMGLLTTERQKLEALAK